MHHLEVIIAIEYNFCFLLKMSKALVFDFDNTLTLKHTGGAVGFYLNFRDSLFGDLYEELLQTLTRLHNQGYLLFINSRADQEGLEEFINLHLPGLFIKIYGGVENADYKAEVLDEIKDTYCDGFRENVVFFDDDLENINTALEYGYNKSIHITEKLPGLLSVLNTVSF